MLSLKFTYTASSKGFESKSLFICTLHKEVEFLMYASTITSSTSTITSSTAIWNLQRGNCQWWCSRSLLKQLSKLLNGQFIFSGFISYNFRFVIVFGRRYDVISYANSQASATHVSYAPPCSIAGLHNLILSKSVSIVQLMNLLLFR